MAESGTDTGGMTREFFTLMAKELLKTYMIGGTFSHNSVALQVSYSTYVCVHVLII